MTIKESAIDLLKQNRLKENNALSYKEIAEKIREQLGSNTQENSIRWYASKFKDEIFNSNTELNEEEIDVILDVATNYDNNETELQNWEYAEIFVADYERKKGNTVVIVTNRSNQNIEGYDIKSTSKEGVERHIEVKSKKSKKITWLQLTPNETARFDKDQDYFIYLVEGDCSIPNNKINITEINHSTLSSMKIEKKIVRFSSLGGLERIKINNTNQL